MLHKDPAAWPKRRLWRGGAGQASLLACVPLAAGSSALSGAAAEALGLASDAEVTSSGCPKVAHFSAFDPQAPCAPEALLLPLFAHLRVPGPRTQAQMSRSRALAFVERGADGGDEAE